MTTILSEFGLALLMERCQKERSKFQQDSAAASPACLEIFRRAFIKAADEEAAWEAVYRTFEPIMRRWFGMMLDRCDDRQSLIDAEDVLQEAFLAFTRSAPQSHDLLNHDSLGPIVQYLKRCTQTALLQIKRKPATRMLSASLEDYAEVSNQDDEISQTTLRIDLKKRLDELLENAEERLVFELRFECNVKPQEIFAKHSELFATYQDVATVIQRLTRRLRKDPVLQSLYSSRQKSTDSAFLKMSMLEEEMVDTKDISVDTPCPYDEVTLLDYLTGLTTTAITAAIENSVACRQAARQLASELGPLLTLAHRLHCPDVEMLIAYHEQELTGTRHLVVRRHLQQCPRCQAELHIVSALDESTPESPLGIVRRIVEAIFQSPTASPQPVRGEELIYETPQLMIMVTVNRSPGQGQRWILRAQLRRQGILATDLVEEARLYRIDTDTEEQAFIIPANKTSLVCKSLSAGSYRLHIFTADEEIVLRHITIGESS